MELSRPSTVNPSRRGTGNFSDEVEHGLSSLRGGLVGNIGNALYLGTKYIAVEFPMRSFRQMPLQSCAACPGDNCYLVQVNR